MRLMVIPDVLVPEGHPGSPLAYQSGSGEDRPEVMRRNMAADGSIGGTNPAPAAARAGWPQQFGEAAGPAAAAFEPSPVISWDAIDRVEREARRLRAEVLQEMLSTAGAWLRRRGRRAIPSSSV